METVGMKRAGWANQVGTGWATRYFRRIKNLAETKLLCMIFQATKEEEKPGHLK